MNRSPMNLRQPCEDRSFEGGQDSRETSHSLDTG